MAPHSSTLAWKIQWMEEPGGLQSMGSLTTERLHFHCSLACIGEGNGNPLQCSCLENPRDGGAWRAAAYGVAQSRTRLTRLSSSRTKDKDKKGDKGFQDGDGPGRELKRRSFHTVGNPPTGGVSGELWNLRGQHNRKKKSPQKWR